MYQFKNPDDTIAAIATPAGQGGIGIVRLSGRRALAIADGMFVAGHSGKPSQFESHTVHHGWIGRPAIDEVLLTVMRAPRSYTAEDTVEISCHGGMAPLKAILRLALDLGARLAEPGEFTRRAFLNGRIDLAQAEAVLDIIHAKTETYLRVSANQLKGDLSTELAAIREQLMELYTEIEAIVNFPEDEIDSHGREHLLGRLTDQDRRVDRLLETSAAGRMLREGVRIVLCGKPNVGKSSLLNALLKQPRAIVTDIPGTTRDVLEEDAQIQGIPLQLVDTAGILEPRDLVEQEAVKRTHESIAGADVVVFVLDGSRPLDEQDRTLAKTTAFRSALVLLNKSDLPASVADSEVQSLWPDVKALSVSALTRQGIGNLEQAIVGCVMQKDIGDVHGILVSNLRHIESLKQAHEALQRARQLIGERLSWEFISEEIKIAVNHLDGITGRNIDQDLLDRIFSSFCIGK